MFNFHACVGHMMHGMLEGFMAYLEQNELVRFDMRNEDRDHFISSTHRLQKYVFLAEHFGLDMHYEYDTYMCGPQSTKLMGDYKYSEDHSTNSDGRMATAQVAMRFPESFRSEEFLNFVRGRDDGWLRISTTLMERSGVLTNRKDLIENVEWTTINFSIEYIAGVLDELLAAHMIDLKQ